MRRGIRWILATALVAHGLGNAVLTLRGVDALAPGVWSAPLTAVCVIAIVGFVAAGLAVAGVRTLRRLSLPAAVAAGTASLIGYVALRHADLWPGVVLSVILPVGVALWARTAAPAERPRRRAGTVVDAAALALLAWITASAVLWPWHRGWGTTPTEWSIALPGDHSPRLPAMEILHGVSIKAPPSAVWPWLVQIGQDRAGFYSYERLERLFGADIHNVREIRPEWQTRTAGELVPATQEGYLGGVFGERPGWLVAQVEPNRALVLRNWGAFVLESDGDGGTRFLIRSTISNPEIPVWAAALNFTAFELPHFIMQRRMMLGIKALAEQHPLERSAR
jgi:hypothetical protein